MTSRECYRIVVKGHLDQDWSAWFDGLAITYDEKGDTVLTGPLEDQASLYGALNKVRDRGLVLVEVTRVEPKMESGRQQ